MVKRLAQWLIQVTPGGGLLERTLKSGMWVGAMSVIDRMLQIILLLVLAALLDPKDFGLMGIALLTLSAIGQFTKLGIDAALIQRRESNVDAYLNTVWTMEAVRGLLLASVAFLAAPYVAAFFSEPRAVDILRFIALSPLLLGIRNPGVVYFQKDLEFHKQFVYQLSGSFLNFVVAIVYAVFIAQTVWALVIGYVVADAVRFVVSYLLHSHRPRPSFNSAYAREMFSYGKWITGAGIISFLVSEGDDVIVGYLLGATSLGFYQVAYRVARAPATEITHVISTVMFPTYSKLQDDIAELREAFFQTVRMTTLVSFPVGVGIIVVAPTFVSAFMNPEWEVIVVPMQLIALYGTVVSFAATFGAIWKALGRPDYVTKLGAARTVIMAILIVPMVTRYGITGAALVVTGTYLLAIFPVDVYLVVRSVDTSYRKLFGEIAYPVVASVAMGLSVVAVRLALPPMWPVAEFALLVAVGGVSYLLTVLVLDRQFGWGLERNVRRLLSAVR